MPASEAGFILVAEIGSSPSQKFPHPPVNLIADSPERQEAAQAGWDVAYDGMEISL